MNYYNENDPKAAAWLAELIKAGHIPKGEIDTRSIAEVRASDVAGFVQCHFFAGIGGWSLALRLAGWPEDREVWTGSCPCQPFSCAGKQQSTRDERHLWPEFRRLIAERNPSIVFGEQVASRLGREWLARVFTNLETMGYAAAGADLCAAGVGAPHIRQRLYWMAYAGHEPTWRASRPSEAARGRSLRDASGCGDGERVGDAIESGLEGHAGDGDDRSQPRRNRTQPAGPITTSSWSDYRVIQFRDGKTRRIESSIEPLAHGVPARVVRLRGYGNAIVPQVAAEFIKAAQGVI